MTAAQLLPLVNLITDAVKVVIEEYDATENTLPPLSSTAPGPFDSAVSISPELARATKIIEAACAQLSVSVASPAHSILNVGHEFL